MSSRIKCTFWTETKKSIYFLRRYNSSLEVCSGKSYHNAMSEVIAETDDLLNEDLVKCNNAPPKPHADDPRWPTKCEHCDYVFKSEDYYQVFGEPLYKSEETGEIKSRYDLPAGAMWYADWYMNFHGPGPDGHCLVVKLPDGHEWCVDSEANNCTRKGDKTHKCWIREGVPPNVTAGKSGNTCSAGAGSIASARYHGFLRNGYLEEC